MNWFKALIFTPFLAFGQLVPPPSGMTAVDLDTVSGVDTALVGIQIPGYLNGQSVKMRRATLGQLSDYFGGGGGGGGGAAIHDSLAAHGLGPDSSAGFVKSAHDTATIHVLNPYKDTLFLPRPLILWNRLAGRGDSLDQRDWVLIGNGSASFLGHVDTYLSGHPYPWGPDSGLRAYQRFTIGSPRPDSANAAHILYSWSAGGKPLVPIKFVMNNNAAERLRFEIDTGTQSTGWAKSFGGFWVRNRLLVKSDFGPALGQPTFINASSLAEFVTDSASNHLTIAAHGAAAGAQFTGYATGGSRTSPSASINGNQLVGFFGRGWSDGSYTGSRGGVAVEADGGFTSTSQGAYLRFLTTDSGSTTMGSVGLFWRKNFHIGPTAIRTGGSGLLVMSNSSSDPTTITDRVALYARDRSAGNAALTVSAEAAIVTGEPDPPTDGIPFCYGSAGTPVCGLLHFTRDP